MGLVQRLAAALNHQLDTRDEVSAIVSGGSSPIECFGALSNTGLAWNRTHIVLSDERWVAPDHDDSNEKLIRTHLLVDSPKMALPA